MSGRSSGEHAIPHGSEVSATLGKHTRDWDELARVDPLWAILTDPSRRSGRWDPSEFFASGAAEISRIMQQAERLGLPSQRSTALDFGCGVGRLTRALAEHFECCVGVDISDSMLAQAREWNRHLTRCRFLLNTGADLGALDSQSFDLVYSNIVLQHLPSKKLIDSYVTEFIRVLADGGLLVFQLRRYIPWKNRLQARRRVYRWLRALGAKEDYLLNSLKLTPMRMSFMPESRVEKLIQAAGGVLLWVERLSDTDQIYYVTRRQALG